MLKNMKTQTHLKPGQKGTKRLVAEYGQSLVCVRYRYDKVRRVRLKTVEIIVEEKAWPFPPEHGDGDMIALRVGYAEKALRAKLKAVGGRWDPVEKVWRVPFCSVQGTELEARILKE
ncbi:hypothetical protein [Citrifermentans bremense]|uniref:Uncharacterized protein n=1 Tax=Citrifermentans bremense TaxID=60035 RepID=A0A6S6LY65_9BACT|nr:hypothetical protein [Citrifermentans bremense]